MIPPLPNLANPLFWVGAALIVLYFGVDYIGQLPAAVSWMGSGLNKFFVRTSVATVPVTGAVITAEQASAAMFVLARYLATQKDAPEFKAICAGLKTLEPAA